MTLFPGSKTKIALEEDEQSPDDEPFFLQVGETLVKSLEYEDVTSQTDKGLEDYFCFEDDIDRDLNIENGMGQVARVMTCHEDPEGNKLNVCVMKKQSNISEIKLSCCNCGESRNENAQ